MLRARTIGFAAVSITIGCSAPSARDAGFDAAEEAAPDAVDAPRPTTCPAQGRFCDATAIVGLDATFPAQSVNAIAIEDIDDDGRDDVLVAFATIDLLQGGVRVLLQRDGHFDDATASLGLAGVGPSNAITAADLDGDGDADLVVSPERGAARLFRRDASGFTEVTPSLGNGDDESYAVAVSDLDRDGALDLAMAIWRTAGDCDVANNIPGCPGTVRVFRQTAPWTFTQAVVMAPPRRAYAVRAFDWDDDGHDELLVASDFGVFDGGNQVLRVVVAPDRQSFSLLDATYGTGFGAEVFGMGVAPIDVDGDGHAEIAVANLGELMLLRRDAGSGVDIARIVAPDAYGFLVPDEMPTYRAFDPANATESRYAQFQEQYLDPTSPRFPSTKWGPLVFDADDDGIDDAYVPTHAVGLWEYPERAIQPPMLLHGTGTTLEDASARFGLDAPLGGASAGIDDLDGDGDLDLVLVDRTRADLDALAVLRNDASTGNVLNVVAADHQGSRHALGATVTIQLGGRTLTRWIDGSNSVYGSVPARAHFGLGDARVVDHLAVRFADGTTVTRDAVPAGSVVVTEP